MAGHQIADRGAHHADVIDAAVLVEALVLGDHHRLFHQLRHFMDAGKRTTLLAEFPIN